MRALPDWRVEHLRWTLKLVMEALHQHDLGARIAMLIKLMTERTGENLLNLPCQGRIAQKRGKSVSWAR